jgi:ornithine cyclodeaminase/alanine dehydrogenase-like protein (mu-crystallin family)
MNQEQALQAEMDKVRQTVDIGKNILYLTQEECIKLGPNVAETLVICEDALVSHGNKEYEMPAKIGVHPWPDVFFHAMPAYMPRQMACGIKWIECFPRNPLQFNLPQTTGLMILNEILTGVPMVIMDCAWLTAMRTPAVTAIAARALHADAESFGMFGCGVQGVGHVRFLAAHMPKLKKIYVYDIIEERMDGLIKELQPEIEIPIIKGESFEQVTKSCEVLSSATIITKEVLGAVKREWVSPGQTILPCDLNTFLDPRIQLEADKYIVDSIDEHTLFAGMGYFPDGLPKVYGETGEIVAGVKPGRTGKDELIVCSNIGMSVLDVVMARAIFEKALATGTGRILPL